MCHARPGQGPRGRCGLGSHRPRLRRRWREDGGGSASRRRPFPPRRLPADGRGARSGSGRSPKRSMAAGQWSRGSALPWAAAAPSLTAGDPANRAPRSRRPRVLRAGAGRGWAVLRKRTGALGLGIRFRNKLLWRFSGKKKVVAPSLTSRQAFGRKGGSAPVHSSLCDRAGKAPSDRPGAGWRPAGSQLSHWDRDQKKNTITGQATKVPNIPNCSHQIAAALPITKLCCVFSLVSEKSHSWN